MTDDKALVERPCTCHADDAPSVCQKKYALNECLIEAQAAEIERLRKAGTKLAGYAGHDDDCEDVTGAYPGSCSCGYTNAWKAWAALGEAK